MTAVCREGHRSDEADYCSVCGAPILSGSGSAVPPIPVPRSSHVKTGVGSPAFATTCPLCGEPRHDPDDRFCEVCRYDFINQRVGPPPVAAPASPLPIAVIPAAVGPLPPVATPSPAPTRWEIMIAVDPTLDTEPDSANPCPPNQAEITLSVDKPEMLVGRHDETRAIHPEVSLHDPGASRRHAKFVVDPDGTVALQDLASTNGTQVNGKDVPPGTRRPLCAGDQVTLGRWTRITLRSRA